MNKDDLERMIDELGLKAVLALIATICQERADCARATQGYNSEPCRTWMQDGANLRAVLRRLNEHY